jgi:VWFA-related protein
VTVRVTVVALGFAAGMTLMKAQTPPASPQQTFRAGTDVVMVDVSVKSGDRVVTGLGPDDFVLTDNGIRQRIESVEATAVPIDLTLVVDLSGNLSRPWMSRIDPAKVAESVEKEMQEVTRSLRPADRVRLLAIDSYVQQIWPLEMGTAQRSIQRLEFDGLGSVYDTLAAALMHPVEPARRHVVIARTKGVDTISAVSVAALRAIADRSDALFHLVVMETALQNDVAMTAFQANTNFLGLVEPTNRSWVPHRSRLVSPVIPHQVLSDGVVLRAGLETTGGRWHQATGFSVPSLTGTFRETFENFRQGYMLRYTPKGVMRTGWHTIAVTVPKSKGYTVRARRGYGIEDPPPAPAVRPVPATPKTLAELTAAYEAAAFQSVANALRQTADPQRLIRDFEEDGNPWPAKPRREAGFAIELAEAGVFSPRAETRDQAVRLLERFTRLIRQPLGPDAFERQWYYAVLTLLQGTIRPPVIEAFADRALSRFPNEPRFLLARAIAVDQRSTTAGASRTTGTASSQPALESIRRLYEALTSMPDAAAESRIRLAWTLQRMGRHREALAQLDAADVESRDGSLRYLRHLFRGHVLGALGRPDDAAVAYRAAGAIAPEAQSAQVALMNGLIARGDRAGAQALAERIQSERPTEFDPWWMYWQGQYRLYGQVMVAVREAGR